MVIVSRDGEEIPIEVNATPIIENEKVVGIHAIMRDITQRKKAEESLAESEKRYKLLYETSNDAIMTLEPPMWKFTSGNPATVHMFGTETQEKFTSLGPWDLSPKHQPDGQLSSEKAGKMIGKAMKDGSCFFEWTHKRYHGEEFAATVLLSRMESKGKRLLQATVRDVSELKTAEKELEEHHQNLERLVTERTAELQAASDELKRNYQQQSVLNSLLKVSIEDLTFDEMLDRTIEYILEVPWVPVLPNASIHLVEDEPDVLVLKAARGLSEENKTLCAKIKFGFCICGRVAESGKAIYSDHMDYRHDIVLKDVGEHSEYCAPLKIGNRVIGVIKIHVQKEYAWNDHDTEFMRFVTGIISSAIQRKTEKIELSKLYNAVEHSADLLFITAPDGRIEYVNPSFERVTGFSGQEAIGSKPSIMKSGKMGLDYYEDVWTTIKSGEVISAEVTNRRKNGEIWYYDQTITPFKDGTGNITHFISTGKDVTERKKIEENLRESEEKYSTIVEKGNDGIIIIQNGLFMYGNTKMTDLTGFEIVEIIGQPFLDFVSPAFRKHVARMYEMRMAGKHIPNKYEIEILSKDGKAVPVEVNATLIEYEGKLADMAIIRDITERKRMEQEREKLYDDLKRAYTELKEAQAKLVQSEKLAGMGTMAAGVAHEINNPLQIIIGLTELLMEENDPDQIAQDLGEVLEASERIRKIVTNLTRYSRDVKTIDTGPVNMNDVIKKGLEISRFSAQFKSIDIRTDLEEIPSIVANPGELEQVFINLVTNAVQAMEGTGRLEITSALEDGNISVYVADTGPGISRENIDKIYDPFFTTKDVGQGTGLGLHIVHTIVAKYKGTVNVDSEVGKGTTFVLRFPTTAS